MKKYEACPLAAIAFTAHAQQLTFTTLGRTVRRAGIGGWNRQRRAARWMISWAFVVTGG